MNGQRETRSMSHETRLVRNDAAVLVDATRTSFPRGGGRRAVIADLPADLPRATADRERASSES